MRGILLQKKAEGKTIILASHNKEDLDILSDVTIKMDAGQLVVA
ncbi:hypothetical protein [Agathobacter sp.]|nr:hypothetical protein [Agathobacter sp.]